MAFIQISVMQSFLFVVTNPTILDARPQLRGFTNTNMFAPETSSTSHDPLPNTSTTIHSNNQNQKAMSTKKTTPTSKPAKYIDLIGSAPNAQEQLANSNEDALLQLQSDILATRRALTVHQSALRAAKSAVPFDTRSIMDAKGQVEATERGLAALEALKTELF